MYLEHTKCVMVVDIGVHRNQAQDVSQVREYSLCTVLKAWDHVQTILPDIIILVRVFYIG